uniref:GBF-interacting protein 1 N-terminal domain-containing protein n=1 Tax=Kalanchoe fedtschenkoi TaxID=63787 RepID=A0A7N0SVT3_KALFE
MSGGARVSSGITGGLKKTIQDIREIAGQHTDEDIYAMLRDCSMDPNETIQRLLHLDTFHEVKKKNGRRKENVEIRAFDNPGQQHGARLGRGAKVGRGNFHWQRDNARRNLGGSKEHGFTSISKGPNSEIKAAPQSSGSVHVEVNGKNSQGGAPHANVGEVIYAGHDSVPDSLIPGEARVPTDGSEPSALTCAPANISAKQETILSTENHVNSAAPSLQPIYSSLETLHLGAVLSPSNSIHVDQYPNLKEDATWFNDKIQNDGPISFVPKNVDTAESQLTDFNGNVQPWQANCAAKDVTFKETGKYAEEQSISKEDTSASNEDASKFNASDGHVVFPDHVQVPEAYKTKLTFGSFDFGWAVDGKQTSGGNGTNRDTRMDDSFPVKTVSQFSIVGNGIISTVKDAQETEDPSYLQSPPPLSENAPSLTGHTSSNVVTKIDHPELESLLHNGGPGVANHSPNYVFGYAPVGHLQAHDSAEPQGGNFTASSTANIDQNSSTQPSVVSQDMVSSPPPAPLLRQTYHSNFFPYGHYYPHFFVPQVQQYITYGGFPQQPSVANVYLTSSAAAAAGIKYSHQQQKQGSNAGTDGYIGVPSGYSPFVPYAFPYGLPPAVIPGNVGGDDDLATQSKENTTTNMTEQQIESSGEWMGGTGRAVAGLQVSPFYNHGPGQVHHMAFPPMPAGFGALGGVYHPAAQTAPAPQLTAHPHLHQPQPVGSAEAAGMMAPAGFYQQQPQGAHIAWNNKQ